mmetsp:Transcript_53203/g.64128  ORF Transcript_53203/g.64128 Transcript_53203/m.64128 type:complete len:561 (+) Transcript_53203:68-1750(+)|eukprot:CAMPEP_0172500568 /NCGR_PEP_ID=MMETSP1066-20121228/140106_1 /TAXON_ID=671091 /ORGANISM="Coscinodiscus wailesii, Strain CCMP2513" /LENGTH=560 /DNA_ID=CAMNT_0013274867 /DNA_START=61 /DNA_END=1743 /DNA_ORIENTATION=+
MENLTEGEVLYLPGDGIDLSSITNEIDVSNRHTKIVCTLGPACWDEETLGYMIDAGMTMARLCCSHGNIDDWASCLGRFRKVAKRRDSNIALMMETYGPQIRTGYFANDAKEISLTKGEFIVLTCRDQSHLGDHTKIAITGDESHHYSPSSLPDIISEGQEILLDRGSCVLTVTSVDVTNREVKCRIENSAVIEPNRPVNIPGIQTTSSTMTNGAGNTSSSITEKDRRSIVEFGVGYGVDFIAISGVRTPDDVRAVRKLVGSAGKDIRLVAKIENREGLQNLAGILRVSDAIMIMRGELSRELEPQKITMVQRYIFDECRLSGKPSIAATECLMSMVNYPRPSRLECTDAAMAIVDGADCVCLGGETAVGDYPVEAAKTIVRLVSEAESAMAYDTMYIGIRNSTLGRFGKLSSPESVANSAVRTAYDVGAKLILLLSESGDTAKQVAKYCPRMPVLVLTPSARVARQCFGMFRGVYAFKVDDLEDTDKIIKETMDEVVMRGVAKEGDCFVIVCGGSKFQRGSTNQVRVEVIENHYWDEPTSHNQSYYHRGLDATSGCFIS